MPVRLTDLPNELLTLIFNDLPSLWSVIALRLSCKHLDAVYLRTADTILDRQARRLLGPIKSPDWMTQYAIGSSVWCSPAFVHVSWEDKKSNFTNLVERRLLADTLRFPSRCSGPSDIPVYKLTVYGHEWPVLHRIGPPMFQYDQRKMELRLHKEGKVNVKHSIVFTYGNYLILDTMHARMRWVPANMPHGANSTYYEVLPVASMDVDEFWRRDARVFLAKAVFVQPVVLTKVNELPWSSVKTTDPEWLSLQARLPESVRELNHLEDLHQWWYNAMGFVADGPAME